MPAATPKTPAMPTAEETAQKHFDEEDKRWSAPRFFVTGFVTLLVCISAIYMMSTTTGCSLQIVP
jgi:hypothetical protein